jgi:hypothetical protein
MQKPRSEKDADGYIYCFEIPSESLFDFLISEIFTFATATGGTYKGKEWDLLVQPVITKWWGFVKKYV